MRTKNKLLMSLFAIIVLAWAFGIGALVLWQTTFSKNKKIETTQAAYPTVTAISITPTSSQPASVVDPAHSHFGDIIK